MKHLALSIASIGLVAVSTFSPKAYADEWNKKTIVTVNGDIQVPNKVLPAGTYVFKLLDSQSDRHIVQVFDKNEQHLQTTVLAIPNYRLEPTGRTVLTFYETAPGVPKPVRAWFYPGDNFGQEFVYSKAQLAEFARIKTTTNESEVATVKQPEPAPEAQPQQPAAQEQQQVAQNMEPTPSPAEPEPQPEPQPAPQEQPQQPAPETPKTLPQTSSSLPLIGLGGLLSIGLFGLIKFVRA